MVTMTINPGYYAVLTAEIRYDAELSDFEKVMAAEITALCNKEGFCFAGNDYFARLYGRSERTISRALGRLKMKRFIEIELDRAEIRGTNRRIYLARRLREEMAVKKSETTGQKCPVEGSAEPTTGQKCPVDSLLVINKKKNTEQAEPAVLSHFAKIWQKMPLKLGKNEATRRYKTSCRTQQDRDDMDRALEKYLEHLKANPWKQPMQGKTWLSEWRDWIDWKEPARPVRGAAAAGMTDEQREAKKAEIKALYARKRRKDEELTACDDDHRRWQLRKDVEALKLKINRLEDSLHVGTGN